MTTNDTRTARERAEDASRLMFPYFTHGVTNRLTSQLQGAYQEGFLARDAEVMPVDKLYVKRDAEPTTVTAEELDAEFLKAREEIHAVSQFQPASYLVHVNDANTVIDRLQKRVMNRFRIEGDEA